MKTIINKTEGHTVYLTVELNTEDIEQFMKRIDKQSNNIDEKCINKDIIIDTVIDKSLIGEKLSGESLKEIIPSVCSMVMQEQKLERAMQPMVNIIQIEPPILEMIIPMKPAIKLCDYHNIKIAPDSLKIEKEEVNLVLEVLRHNFTACKSVERPVQEGDMIILDMEANFSGHSFISKKEERRKVAPEFFNDVPGLYEKIIGMKKGVEYKFVSMIPEDYSLKAIAGSDVKYNVKVQDIQEVILPEVDDGFANKIAPGVGTLDKLRERIEKNLEKEREYNAQSVFEYKLMDTLIKESQLQYPAIMVEIETDRLMKQYKQELKASTKDNNNYGEKLKNTSAIILRKQLHELAEKRILWSMVIDEVAKVEDIEVSDKEMDEEIENMIYESGDFKDEQREVLNSYQNRLNLYELMKARKTLKRLAEIVKVNN